MTERRKKQSCIKTKSIYEAAGKFDGWRILVTRYHPRGVKRQWYDAWARSLAPSAALLKKYKNGDVQWPELEKSLVSELAANPDAISMINSMHKYTRKHPATLLCYEPEGEPCHRHLLKKIIDNPDLLERMNPPLVTSRRLPCTP